MSLDWKPGRGGPPQGLLLWIRLLAYAIGIAGFVYSLAEGNELGLVTSTVIATGADVGRMVATLFRVGHAEYKATERLIRDAERRDGESDR